MILAEIILLPRWQAGHVYGEYKDSNRFNLTVQWRSTDNGIGPVAQMRVRANASMPWTGWSVERFELRELLHDATIVEADK